MGFQRARIALLPASIERDPPPEAVPAGAWTSGNNVVFRDGVTTRVDGFLPVYGAPIANPQALINLQLSSANWWVYGGADKLGATSGGAHSDITPASGWANASGNNPYTLDRINNVVTINHAAIDPHYWPGSGLALPLPGWLANHKARTVRAARYHLFAAGIVASGQQYPNLVLWSDAAEPGTVPGTWTPAPDNQAGSVELSADGGDIVDMAMLRDQMTVYKRGAIWAATYVGGNDVWAWRRVTASNGAMARNCVAEIGGAHVILTPDDVLLFDGQGLRSIIDNRNRRWLFSQIDAANFGAAHVAYDARTGEVWINFPTSGSVFCNQSLVWKVGADSWGAKSFDTGNLAMGAGISTPEAGARTWATETDSWQDVQGGWVATLYSGATPALLASVGGLIVQMGASVQDNTSRINAVAQKTGISLGEPEARKNITRIWPRMSGVPGDVVYWRVGASDTPDSAVRWSQPRSYVIGQQQSVSAFASGRYMALEVSSSGAQPWTVSAVDVEYTAGGRW